MLKGKRIITLISLCTILFSAGWFASQSHAGNEETYYKIDKGLLYLRKVFETVSRSYVDELDPEHLSKSAIEGMLNEFDPYTVFFEDPGSHQMQMITRGKYGGVGMEISVQDGAITIIAPMEGTPAQRAGIRAGDIIHSINSKPASEMSSEDASQRLRGKIGTSVSIEIRRAGIDTPLAFDLIREEIILKDVTYSGFLEPGVAYFRLSAFSDKAGSEMETAVNALQRSNKIERVILDLRGNPGGLLTAAVDVLDIFLPPGKLVVSTRGSHEKEHKFYTEEKPLLPEVPLVVLVNQSSASASEIVAGALQDLDRGVVIGEATFGKGLVQKVYPVDKISQAFLKITTAKYYIPSGRSIQKEDYKKNNNVFIDRSDSVEYNRTINYYTANGRVVHSGGGITPDLNVDEEPFDLFMQHLVSHGYFFRYAVEHLNRHPDLRSRSEITVNREMLQEFELMVRTSGFDVELEGEKELRKFLEISRQQKYDPELNSGIQTVLGKLQTQESLRFRKHGELIKHLLKVEFAEKLGGTHERIRMLLARDPQVNGAIRLLEDQRNYRGLLANGN